MRNTSTGRVDLFAVLMTRLLKHGFGITPTERIKIALDFCSIVSISLILLKMLPTTNQFTTIAMLMTGAIGLFKKMPYKLFFAVISISFFIYTNTKGNPQATLWIAILLIILIVAMVWGTLFLKGFKNFESLSRVKFDLGDYTVLITPILLSSDLYLDHKLPFYVAAAIIAFAPAFSVLLPFVFKILVVTFAFFIYLLDLSNWNFSVAISILPQLAAMLGALIINYLLFLRYRNEVPK